MMRYFAIKALIAFIAVLLLPVPVFATSTIILSESENGVYQLQGVNMENAAAIDITIFYDAAALAHPRVAPGPLISGAMTAVNPNVPGTVRIAIIRTTPVTGSGIIASISFDLSGNGRGKITSLIAKLASVNGSPLAALAQINTGNETTAEGIANAVPTLADGPAKRAALPSTSVVLDRQPDKPEEVYPVSETVVSEEQHDLPIRQASVEGQDTTMPKTGSAILSAPPSTARQEDMKIIDLESVLDRFKAYRGERTVGAFTALFHNEAMNGFRQEPPIALADGKSAVESVFLAEPGEITPDDIQAAGARLVSVRRDPGNTNRWVLTVIPVKGIWRAAFTIIRGKSKTTYPLTIAPKIIIPSNGAGFTRYLKAGKTAKANKYDLNGDGKRDYLDDYIFTANYLAAMKKALKAVH